MIAPHRITTLADVRSYPGSRRSPQFNQESLQRHLTTKGVDYRWIKALGGRRRASTVSSPHSAWNNPAFRAYADHADSADFQAGLRELISLTSNTITAFMCAEGLWWRCHRRIISDWLVVSGHRVLHIMPDGKLVEHKLPSFAIVRDGKIAYARSNHEKQ